MTNNYECIDLPLIREKIADLSFIYEAKQYILNEDISFNPLQIKRNINDTNSALSVLKKDINVNFDGIYNPTEILNKADKGIALSGKEFNSILSFHNHCERIKKQFTSFDSELIIRDYSDAIMIEKNVFSKIEKAIDNNGNIKADASNKLKQIYDELNRVESSLIDRAHKFIANNSQSLQESQIYTRNDRITFLVKNVDKNKFGGYTYSPSSSGLAYYIEPTAFIELNNKKVQLEEDKNREIERILIELTYLLSSVSDEYIENFNSLLKLNVIFAKANYGIINDAKMATIGNYIDLKDICHPLIDKKEVISNNYSLKDLYKGIVISGSNTGGKTVSLKLIGLSVLLTYLGIPLICSSAEVPLFDNVYVDMDDNQSITSSLSTFSAHITNINSILKQATANSLILIDELISGTDPKQAQAISIAILNKIKQIGSKFVITTHFDDIKNYAYEDNEILLSSVGFDLETLKPTYKYYENTIGSSNALEIASRYFSDDSIIKDAKEILNANKTKQEKLLEQLSFEIDQNNKLLEENKNKEIKINELLKEYESKINDFENEKVKLRKEYLEELNDYINKTKDEANEYLKEIKNTKSKETIKKFDSIVKKEKIEDVTYNIGDIVTVGQNTGHGTIESIDGQTVVVNINSMKIKTNINNLHKISSKQNITLKPQINKIRTKASVSHELNLVGQRVEDGLIMLEEYLDKAFASNYSQVKIIHGIGTGALRNAIHDKLKKLKFVKSYNFGDFHDGGSAVTIVEFKK